MRQSRLHIMPLGFITILAGSASISTVNYLIGFKSFLLAIVTSFVSSAPNDYFDVDIDQNIERKKFTGAYVQDKNLGKYVALLSVVSAVLTSLVIGGFTGFCIFSITVLSILYSVPPFRFKGRAPLDSICNGLGAFFVFSLGVGLAEGGFNNVISGAYWFSLIVAGIHGITAIPDMKQDKKDDLKTLPILLGKRMTIAVTQVFILAAMVFEQFSYLTTLFLSTMFLSLFILYKDWDEIKMNYILLLGVIYFTLYFIVYTGTRGII